MHIQRHKRFFAVASPDQVMAKYMPTPHDHVKAFQSLVKYLIRLRQDGDIDNDTFDKLVRQIAATSAEVKISKRIDRVLNKISLDRLSKIL